MKSIYFVLTYTGTILSKIIKIYTKKEYSHVSISLDKELTEMYSFGRMFAYYPFWGGFVHEGINIGTFKRFKSTKCVIYEYKVTVEQYNNIKKIIADFEKNKKVYGFNYVGLVAVAFDNNVKYSNRFYCAEFVKYLLDEAGISTNLPKKIKPMDFTEITNELVYRGLLINYKD